MRGTPAAICKPTKAMHRMRRTQRRRVGASGSINQRQDLLLSRCRVAHHVLVFGGPSGVESASRSIGFRILPDLMQADLDLIPTKHAIHRQRMGELEPPSSDGSGAPPPPPRWWWQSEPVPPAPAVSTTTTSAPRALGTGGDGSFRQRSPGGEGPSMGLLGASALGIMGCGACVRADVRSCNCGVVGLGNSGRTTAGHTPHLLLPLGPNLTLTLDLRMILWRMQASWPACTRRGEARRGACCWEARRRRPSHG